MWYSIYPKCLNDWFNKSIKLVISYKISLLHMLGLSYKLHPLSSFRHQLDGKRVSNSPITWWWSNDGFVVFNGGQTTQNTKYVAIKGYISKFDLIFKSMKQMTKRSTMRHHSHSPYHCGQRGSFGVVVAGGHGGLWLGMKKTSLKKKKTRVWLTSTPYLD